MHIGTTPLKHKKHIFKKKYIMTHKNIIMDIEHNISMWKYITL